MTTAATEKRGKRRLELEAARPSLEFHLPAISSLSLLEHVHVKVLELVAAQGEPLTRGQISRLIGVPANEVRAITETLCDLRLLRRLNTIIESYVGPAPTSR